MVFAVRPQTRASTPAAFPHRASYFSYQFQPGTRGNTRVGGRPQSHHTSSPPPAGTSSPAPGTSSAPTSPGVAVEAYLPHNIVHNTHPHPPPHTHKRRSHSPTRTKGIVHTHALTLASWCCGCMCWSVCCCIMAMGTPIGGIIMCGISIGAIPAPGNTPFIPPGPRGRRLGKHTQTCARHSTVEWRVPA